MVPSRDNENFGPLDADTVVAEPMRAVSKALNISKYNLMSSFSNPFWTPIKKAVPLDPMEDLNAKMTFKRGLAADCQANIDIENNKLDHVNKRLRELRR